MQLGRDLPDEPALRIARDTESGLFYSGRQNLNLGLSVATKFGDADKEYVGEFRMYYYW